MDTTEAKEKITQEVEEILQGTDQFLIDIQVSKNKKVLVFVDADSAIDISKCKSISRQLYKRIVEKGIYEDGSFALEVSSPGLDHPLSNLRQYHKNVGRLLEVKTQDEKQTEGRLTKVTEDEITLEIKNKKETQTVTIPLAQVSQSIIQPEFK